MQETGNKFPKMTDFSFTDDSFDYNITTSYFLSIRRCRQNRRPQRQGEPHDMEFI